MGIVEMETPDWMLKIKHSDLSLSSLLFSPVQNLHKVTWVSGHTGLHKDGTERIWAPGPSDVLTVAFVREAL